LEGFISRLSGKMTSAAKRIPRSNWMLLIASIIATGTAGTLAVLYANEYGFFRVPFASWFVFLLVGLIFVLNGAVLCSSRRYRRVSQDLEDLRGHPLQDTFPTVYGHKALDRSEFVTLLQILFKNCAGAKYLQVNPLPGGYGGGTTVQVKLQRQRDAPSLRRAFVVKLGPQREMADEHEKFQKYVLADLTRAAKFFRYAVWEEWAAVAYEFAGLDPDHEIQNYHQFYQGYATSEVTQLTARVFEHLGQAWYQNLDWTHADPYQEYRLLGEKREEIIGHIGEIVTDNDPYRANFSIVPGRLQPYIKPDFCPDPTLPWRDPVEFLRTWPDRGPDLSLCRSIVHGDLHGRNVLVEIKRDGTKQVWFIDFSHTGNGLSGTRTRQAQQANLPVDLDQGHVLRDFCRLEADVKFILTQLDDADDLNLAVAFERELARCGLKLYDLLVTLPPIEALRDDRFREAWQIVREIRHQATPFLTDTSDLRPYYWSLLHATLPIVYYHTEQFTNKECELQQKRYALLSAGVLCSHL
jgi:hypothetical protein